MIPKFGDWGCWDNDQSPGTPRSWESCQRLRARVEPGWPDSHPKYGCGEAPAAETSQPQTRRRLVSNKQHGSMPLQLCIVSLPSLVFASCLGHRSPHLAPPVPLLGDLQGSPNLPELLLFLRHENCDPCLGCCGGWQLGVRIPICGAGAPAGQGWVGLGIW